MTDLFLRDRQLLAQEYKTDNWSCASGMGVEELREKCALMRDEWEAFPQIRTKAEMAAYVLEHVQVEVNPFSLYADKFNHGNILEKYREKKIRESKTKELRQMIEKYKNLQEARAFTGWSDFGHICPDWDYALHNGFTGILRKLQEQLNNPRLTDDQRLFYASSEIVYQAVLQLVGRFAVEAEKRKAEHPNMPLVAASLKNLTVTEPRTLHEAIQFILLYYEIQNHIDCADVRSLGCLDALLNDYYQRDREAGRITEADAKTLIKYFLFKLFSKNILANIPFALGGTGRDGKNLTNEMTFLILKEYIALDINDPKIHIHFNEKTDEKIIQMVLESIAAGKNSFVFMNDAVVEASFAKLGIDAEEAHNYMVVGCYEPCVYRKEIPSSCNGRINIPKAVELAVSNGIDMLTGNVLVPPFEKEAECFEDLMERVRGILKYFSDCCIDIINIHEKNYPRVMSSPFFSAAFEESMKKGVDIFAGGAKYNNSSINAFGLATAVDSLMAVKKTVFEEKLLTLGEFADILRQDWEGHEQFRLRCKSRYPQYGTNDREADAIMVELCNSLASYINGRQNGRNGIYRMGTFSIDWRFEFGMHTGASADGRKAGETLSKNMSAVNSCVRGGVTSLINSVTKLDFSNIPNGTVLDIMLHKSCVDGSDGVEALKGLLLTYMKKGGIAVQFNVLNPEDLRKAQEQPENYRTLQVRLCGWNVYFVDLSRKEQDEFILQLERQSGC